MADPGQRVVLREQGDGGAVGVADLGAQRGLQSVRRPDHVDPARLDEVGERRCRAVLLEADLRVRGQVVAGRDQGGGELVDGLGEGVRSAAGALVGGLRLREPYGPVGAGSPPPGGRAGTRPVGVGAVVSEGRWWVWVGHRAASLSRGERARVGRLVRRR